MQFEWDEAKRQSVIKTRNVDMVYAALIFKGEVLTRNDERDYDGEIREISLGMVDDECFVVIHTERNGVTRLMSAWKGGRDERDQYQESIARRHSENEGKG